MPSTITNLEGDGIKTTKHLYGLVLSRDSRKQLADRLGLDAEALLALAKQSDLTRIQWVNPTFARVLYEAGPRHARQGPEADAEALYERILGVNEAQRLHKGNIGLNDVKICIEAAHQVDLDVEF